MRIQCTNTRRGIGSILSLAILIGFAAVSHADTPIPGAPAIPVAVAPGTPAPEPPLPGQQQKPAIIVAKKEEEPGKCPHCGKETDKDTKTCPHCGKTIDTANSAAARPNVFQRAMAHLQTREGVASEIAQRDAQIVTLQQQLGQRDQTINQLTTELTSLRTGHTQLEQAVNRLETEQKTVVDTVAGLGFPSAQLPNAGTIDQAVENTVEGIQALLKDEKDDGKRGELMARMIALRDTKK